MVACTDKSPSGQIKSMQKRIDAVEHRVEVLYNQDFNYLVGEYQALDTTVARTKDIHNEMWLLQAYLQQFENQRVVILENVEVSRSQLANLKSDIQAGRFDAETALKYIDDEEKVLHQMEAQINYFQEKFDAQKTVVQQLRKE